MRLSQLKFSSNVIEKCLECKQAEMEVAKIFKGTHMDDDVTVTRCLGPKAQLQETRVQFLVQRLVMHQFGNYVLQKVISTVVADVTLKTQILEALKLCKNSLSQTKHGPRVLQKL